METALKLISENLKTDYEFVKGLKILAVKRQKFELGSLIRDIELKTFPDESNKYSEEKTQASNVRRIMEMCGYKADDKSAFKLFRIMNKYNELGIKFSVDDSCDIDNEANIIFD